MALAWWLVRCLPFPGLSHIYFLFTVRLTNERVGVFLARRSLQHLVLFSLTRISPDFFLVEILSKCYCYHHRLVDSNAIGLWSHKIVMWISLLWQGVLNPILCDKVTVTYTISAITPFLVFLFSPPIKLATIL